MGSCSSHDDFNIYSKKIIRVSDFSTKGVPRGNVQYYDIESKESNSFTIKIFPFKSLVSTSQIILENCLFLIGEQAGSQGSILMKCDLSAKMNQVTIMVNSQFSHFKPSLCIIKKQCILVIGGKNNTKCEQYTIQSNSWKAIPSLPEERFGCSIYFEEIYNIIYCFGGYSVKSNSFHGSVARLNLSNNGNGWDTLITKNYNLLERSFFSIITVDPNTILILGGTTKDREFTDTIIEYKFDNKSAISLQMSLSSPCKIDLYSYIEYKNCYYIIDEENIVHLINKKEGTSDLIQCFNKTNLN